MVAGHGVYTQKDRGESGFAHLGKFAVVLEGLAGSWVAVKKYRLIGDMRL